MHFGNLFVRSHVARDMGVTLNSQFCALYALKATRTLLALLALFLTQRIFMPIYERKVYHDNADPPSLTRFVVTFVFIDSLLNGVLFTILVLMQYVLGAGQPSFIVNTVLLQMFAVDYAVTQLLVVCLCASLGAIIMQKNYFRYRLEGQRAIRAFQRMVFVVYAVLTLVPYSALV
jgi:hypothetical protein